MERNFIVDPEFQDLIPPLSPDEYKRLEQSIIDVGCIEPLVLWNGTLIDGHHRLKICEEHNISYNTVELDFESKRKAMLWSLNKQLGRRNASDLLKIQLVRRFEDIVRAEAKERISPGINQYTDRSKENFPATLKGQARDELGAMAGVSGRTYEKGKRILDEAPEPIKTAVMNDELSINAANNFLNASYEVQDEVFNKVKEDGLTIKQAVNTALKEDRQRKDGESMGSRPDYTIDTMLEEMTANAETFIQMLSRMFEIRRYLYVSDSTNKKKVIKATNDIIKSIRILREGIE